MSENTTSQPVLGPRALVLAAGPVLTIYTLTALADANALAAAPVSYYLWVALLLWSPLPFALPAVLMDLERDATLPQLAQGPAGRVVRALLLIPAMLVSPRAATRVSTALSLAGFALAVAVAWPAL